MDNQGNIKEGENANKSTAFSPPPSTLPSPAPLPPSKTSSPSHEFFFTISMQTPNSPSPNNIVDLAPADDIFFHGHLLPLDDVNSKKKHSTTSAVAADDSNNKSNPKHSFSSLFGLWKWLRRSDEGREEKSTRKKKKKAFEFGAVCWTKHVSMAELLLFFKGKSGEKESREFRRRLHSFSGDSNPREGRWRRRSGESSAPGSMRASPTSSGFLAATTAAGAFSSSDESTMAELQNAVESAIAHCKNSIAVK